MISDKLDKTVFEIVDLGQEKNDREYWLNRTPEERLWALELLRRINYGKDAATARLQRFFEVAQLT